MYEIENFTFHNADNMDIIKQYPDKYFDIAIVDPPYGIKESMKKRGNFTVKQKNGSVLKIKNKTYSIKNWDNSPSDKLYFFELIRISRCQIIFGANYFEFELLGFQNTKPPRRNEYDLFLKNRPYGYIIWDKLNGSNDFSDCEIIYVSKPIKSQIVYYLWAGMMQGEIVSENFEKANRQIGNKSKNEYRIHPTQKPVKLYEWILKNYAKSGDKILDTHLGSGSIAIAIDKANTLDKKNLTFVGIELDTEYFNESIEVFKRHKMQLSLF